MAIDVIIDRLIHQHPASAYHCSILSGPLFTPSDGLQPEKVSRDFLAPYEQFICIYFVYEWVSQSGCTELWRLEWPPVCPLDHQSYYCCCCCSLCLFSSHWAEFIVLVRGRLTDCKQPEWITLAQTLWCRSGLHYMNISAWAQQTVRLSAATKVKQYYRLEYDLHKLHYQLHKPVE